MAHPRWNVLPIWVTWMWLVAACSAPLLGSTPTPVPPTETYTPPPTDTPTTTPTPTVTPTLTPSVTPTASNTPTPSDTPTPEDTPTPSVTPTPEPLIITADGSVNCRYGPSQAYLYAWGLSEGDTATVKGKNANGTWLWVEPHDTNWTCWVSTTAVTADGDLDTVRIVYPQLLTHPDVDPPDGVKASRSGSTVTVSWDAADAAVGLGLFDRGAHLHGHVSVGCGLQHDEHVLQDQGSDHLPGRFVRTTPGVQQARLLEGRQDPLAVGHLRCA